MLSTCILKVAGHCNLACSYCYMYFMGDATWKRKPKIFGEDVLEILVQRIEEHVLEYRLALFEVIIHGGEPLLVGKKELDNILDRFRKIEQVTDCEILLRASNRMNIPS